MKAPSLYNGPAEVLFGSDGRVWVSEDGLDEEEREGRLCIRVYAASPEETQGVLRNLGNMALELLVGVFHTRRSSLPPSSRAATTT